MAARSQSLPEPAPIPPAERLPLNSGDRLTRVEFHRRYRQHPEIKKAELVEGVVYVASPVSLKHSSHHSGATRWLGAYADVHPEVEIQTNVSLILDGDNEVQPDLCMYYGDGRSARAGDDGYLHGAPELVIEISISSASYDLHSKLNAYRRNGVQEYIVWRVFDAAIDWFELIEGAYRAIAPDERGIVHSGVFPGLRLDREKMLTGDLTSVLAEQRRATAARSKRG